MASGSVSLRDTTAEQNGKISLTYERTAEGTYALPRFLSVLRINC